MAKETPARIGIARIVGLAAAAIVTLAATLPDTGRIGVRFCENRPDGIVLELVRVKPDAEPAEPRIHLAVPPDARCAITSPTGGLIRIADSAILRDLKIVSLAIEPTRLDAFEKLAKPARFCLAFGRQDTENARPSRPPSPYFEPVLQALVVNSPVPDFYRREPDASSFPGAVAPPVPGLCDHALKIEVEGPGRVRIALSEIARHAGGRWPVQRAREQIRLWHEGKSHPFRVVPESPEDGQSHLRFLAGEFTSRYTRFDVYWLTWDVKGEGPRTKDKGSRAKDQGRRTGDQETVGDRQKGNAAGFKQASDKETRKSPIQNPKSKIQNQPVSDARYCRVTRWRFRHRLRNPAEGADILFICHPEFVDEVQGLARWRRRQGMRVAVVTSEEAANAFNFGRDEPEAIRRFLAWAYAHWSAPAPAFVVLVGDASAQPKSTDPTVARNFISTLYGEGTDPPAYDDGYVAFLADGRLPQMMLGRLSVNEPGQLTAIAEKLIAHERQPRLGPWRGQLLLLADNGYERLFEPVVTRAIPDHLDVPRIDVRDFPFVDHYNLEKTKISPECREAVVARLSEGAAAVHYVGHGGISLISHEKMLFWTDVRRLANRDRLPLFVQVSCRTGGFDWPEQKWNACLSELLLRQPRAGALGVLAASRALYGDEAYLQRTLFRAYRGRSAVRLGEIKMLMKVQYLLNRRETEFIDSYNLLGDPASRLVFPNRFQRFTVAPTRIEARGEEPLRVHVRGELPIRRRATVTLALRDPLGRLRETTKPVTAQGGVLDAEIELPESAMPGAWKVVAYGVAGSRDPTDYQAVGTIQVVEPPRGYPSDPGGEPDLAFMGNRFEFADEDVVDGETILVHTTIENRGTARSGPTRLTWEWTRTDNPKSTERVANMVVPELYPTERRAVTLRWDPYDVAGAIECVLHIVPAGREQETRNNRLSRTLRIRTKPDLTLKTQPSWRWKGGQVQLILIAANLGETEARDVQVTFSLGDERGPRVPLGEPRLLASRLEAGSESPPREWILPLPDLAQPLPYLYLELGTAEPVAEINKKNNRYRFRIGRPEK